MKVWYSELNPWWNDNENFPSQRYVALNIEDNLKLFNDNVNFNPDGTITIYTSNRNICLLKIELDEDGQYYPFTNYYKKVTITDNGNGIYEIFLTLDYCLTYMNYFLKKAKQKRFNFLRNNINNWDPLLNQEDPLLSNNEVQENYIVKTSIPNELTTKFNFSFTGLNNVDANTDFYNFCNAVTYYVFKLSGSLIAIPVLSTNEVNQPYMWQSGTRPVTTNYRGIKFNFNGDYNNGMKNDTFYIYNFENVLKGLASRQGDNFVGKFFLPNVAYFNPKYFRLFRFTTSFSYNSNSVGGDPFTTQSEQGINFLGIVLSNKIYNLNTQLLSTEAKIQLPDDTQILNTLPPYGDTNDFNQEYLRYSSYNLMNNKIAVEYIYNNKNVSYNNAFVNLYAFVFNQGGYCKINNNNNEPLNSDNGYLSNFTTTEERTLFFGYQLPSETNAYLSWYNANKSQMETTKVTQGLGFAMSSIFSVLGLILSGTGIGAPIGLSMVAGGAMGAFSSISGIAKTNANIADTKRQLQTNFAQSNISDFNFLSLWFWYSSSQNWSQTQYNIWQVQRPNKEAIKRLNNILYFYGYYQPQKLMFDIDINKPFTYLQWAEDNGLKSRINASLEYTDAIKPTSYNDDVVNWIYERLINGVRLWNQDPN